MKKNIVRILAMLMAVLVAVGCSEPTDKTQQTSVQALDRTLKTPANQKMIRWNMGSEPKTLDPTLNSALDASNVINNMFSGLMREKNGKMLPELAEKYELSPDGKTYTFHLRETQWSDGTPLKASDFVYGWHRALTPKSQAQYASQLFYIKGGQAFYEGRAKAEDVAAYALDNKTLQVTLIAPTSYFLELTAFPCYFPVRKDLVEKSPDGAWAKDPKVFISNGPFILKSYKSGYGLVLVRNPHYVFQEDVRLDTIEVLFSPDSPKALKDFEASRLDVVDSVPVESIPSLEAGNSDFYIFPHNGIHFYYINVGHPALKDLRVRKALIVSIDRTALVTTVTKAGQTPATGVVPRGIKDTEGLSFREQGGDYSIPTDYADVETARKLMAEAGYPAGKGFPLLEIKVDDNSEYVAIAKYVAAIWEETLGVQCKVTTYPWAEIQEFRNTGDYMIARGGWIGDYSDPMTFLDIFLSYSGNNDSHWANRDFDSLIEQGRLLTGPERSEKLYQAEKLLADNQVIIPLYYLTDPALVSHRLVGWERTGMGSWYLGRAYIKNRKQ